MMMKVALGLQYYFGVPSFHMMCVRRNSAFACATCIVVVEQCYFIIFKRTAARLGRDNRQQEQQKINSLPTALYI
jgi:hypothetical protein